MAYESMMDFLKPRDRGQSQQEKDMEQNSNTRSLLAGATPLLVGLLSGHTGNGVDIASKALLDEDQRAMKEQNSLIELVRKKRESSGSPVKVLDPVTGNITYQRQDDAIGKQAPYDRRPLEESIDLAKRSTEAREEAQRRLTGKGMQVVENPLTKESMLIDKSQRMAPRGVFDNEGEDRSITPKFNKVKEDRYDKLSTRVKDDLDAIRTVKRGYELSKSNQTLPEAVALNMAVKVTEDRGTDEDHERVTKAVGNIQKIREALKEEKDGMVVRRKIREANALFKIISDTAEESLRRNVERSADAISKTPTQKREARKFFSDLLPEEKKSRYKGSVTVGAPEIEGMTDDELEMRIQELSKGKK